MANAESAKAFAARVKADFNALSYCCDSSTEAQRLLDRALNAATDGEKRHRELTGGVGGRRQPVGVAARYFVLKWYCETSEAERVSWLDATRLREDCLYARALRVFMRIEGKDPFPGVCSYDGDYVDDIVGIIGERP